MTESDNLYVGGGGRGCQAGSEKSHVAVFRAPAGHWSKAVW